MQRLALYRAVTDAEYLDVEKRGEFRNLPGLECKYFAETSAGAVQYARLAHESYGDGPFFILATSMNPALVQDDMRVVVDGSIETVVVPTDLLYDLSRPELVEVVR